MPLDILGFEPHTSTHFERLTVDLPTRIALIEIIGLLMSAAPWTPAAERAAPQFSLNLRGLPPLKTAAESAGCLPASGGRRAGRPGLAATQLGSAATRPGQVIQVAALPKYIQVVREATPPA